MTFTGSKFLEATISPENRFNFNFSYSNIRGCGLSHVLLVNMPCDRHFLYHRNLNILHTLWPCDFLFRKVFPHCELHGGRVGSCPLIYLFSQLSTEVSTLLIPADFNVLWRNYPFQILWNPSGTTNSGTCCLTTGKGSCPRLVQGRGGDLRNPIRCFLETSWWGTISVVEFQGLF